MADLTLNKILQAAATLIVLFIASWILNFVWESFHAVYLYEGHNFNAEKYIPMLLYVATIDGLLVVFLYLSLSLVVMDLLWIKVLRKGRLFLFLLAGLGLAALIEYRAVYVIHKWGYQSHMPTLFGLGLSPLIQLSATGLASLWMARIVLFGHGLFRRR